MNFLEKVTHNLEGNQTDDLKTLLMEGLKRKGVCFCNNDDFVNFLEKKCVYIDDFPNKQKTFCIFEKGKDNKYPFLVYYYPGKIEIEPFNIREEYFFAFV